MAGFWKTLIRTTFVSDKTLTAAKLHELEVANKLKKRELKLREKELYLSRRKSK